MERSQILNELNSDRRNIRNGSSETMRSEKLISEARATVMPAFLRDR
ncbi:hypothetical protein TUMEXPCC7403_08935 [Tumidithrix helvetica PCC 7403]